MTLLTTRLPSLANTILAAVKGHPVAAAVLAGTVVTVLVAGHRAAVLALERWRHRRHAQHARCVQITPPPEVDAAGAEVFWATLAELLATSPLHRLIYGAPHVAFEYRWTGRRLAITCWIPGTVSASNVASAARAAWPGATTSITDADPPLPASTTGAAGVAADDAASVAVGVAVGGTVTLVRPSGAPLRTDHPADPLRPLIQAGAGLTGDQHATVQILARPATPRQTARLRARATTLRRQPGAPGGGLLDGVLRLLLDLITPGPTRSRTAGTRTAPADPVRERDARTTVEAVLGPLWDVAVRYAVAHTNPRDVDPDHLLPRLATITGGIAAAFGVHTARNRLRSHRLPHPGHVLAQRRLGHGFLLPAEQLAALAGLPTDVAVPGLDRAGAVPVPAPVAVPTGGRGTKPLGVAQVGGHAVALPVQDARQHLHVLGATGSGKSTLLTHLILDDVANRRGVVVIDPKGDLATDVLNRLPLSVADRLVLIDPDQPGGATLNPLAPGPAGSTMDNDLVVDNIVSIFARIFARHWGPRIDDVLRVSCLTVMRHPRATLTLVAPLLNDPQFRAPFIADLDDPEGLRGFWDWYNTSPPALRAQVIAPVLARLRAFLLRDFVRDTLGTPVSSFDMAKVLDGGILIARLPKGQLGDDTARLMASFVLASVWQAATARSRLPEHRRRDATVVIDEAHNVLNLAGSVSDMLAEARGYRLSLVLAHQDLAQFPRETVLSISANARNKIFFACSPEDANALARHTQPELRDHDLTHLGAYTAAARLVINARTTPAFTLQTRPPRPVLGHTDRLRAAVRRPAPEPPTDATTDTSAPPGGGASTTPAAAGRRRPQTSRPSAKASSEASSEASSGGSSEGTDRRPDRRTSRTAPRSVPPGQPITAGQTPQPRAGRVPERPPRVSPTGTDPAPGHPS